MGGVHWKTDRDKKLLFMSCSEHRDFGGLQRLKMVMGAEAAEDTKRNP